MFRTRFRIVRDAYLGYEVQFRYWWMPFFMELGCNTYPTLEIAKRKIELHKKPVVYSE